MAYDERSVRDFVFPNYKFIEQVRFLFDEGKINAQVASFLLQVSLWKNDALQLVKQLNEANIDCIRASEMAYPMNLQSIPDKPYILFIRGVIDILTKPVDEYITIVGTRNPSDWAINKATQLSVESSECKLITVSGFAKGIDTVVYEKSLSCGGKTIVVLPEMSLNKLNIHAEVLQISEYLESDCGINKWQYVARDRIAAGLSSTTVIVEAPIRSGTLITAELALDYGRSVYTVLPEVQNVSSYGGIAFTQSRLLPKYIQSLYDIFFESENIENIKKYYGLIAKMSGNKIAIPSKEYRHLAGVNLKKYLFNSANRDLKLFESNVVELLRLGIIVERKDTILFNFSGYKGWQKI